MDLTCTGVLVLLLQTGAPTAPATPHEPPRQGPDGAVADADLLAYSRSPFDKAQMMHKTVVLGTHRGNTLIAEFPCSDLCPTYTTRIIRYELKPGETCRARGGVSQERFVPHGIGMAKREYCVPPVLTAKPSGGAGKPSQ